MEVCPVNRTVRRLVLFLSGIFVIMVVVWSPAGASTFTGVPSPSLNPVFGTLVTFDDKPAGADIFAALSDIPPLGSGDYASVGVASITETSGKGFLGLFSLSPQSPPNYVGTGISNFFDGTILIQFTNPADKVGIGYSDSFNDHTLSIYGSAGPTSAPLESFTIAGNPNSKGNTYAGFERSAFDITYFEITGTFFLIDDLQFRSAVPEPATLVLLCCGLAGLLAFASRKSRAIPTS
jgi:hypothetical protein